MCRHVWSTGLVTIRKLQMVFCWQIKGSIGKSDLVSRTLSMIGSRTLTPYLGSSGFDAPFCTTLVLYGQEYTISGTYSFLSYSCGVGSGTRITAYQTTTGSSETPSSTTSSTTSSTISSPSSQHSSSSEASAPSETSSAPNTPTSTSKPIAASASSGLSQGAQIGIGVGAGLAAAGAFIAASLCLWRRRKVQKSVPEDTHHAHYGDTRDQFWGPSGVDQHGYPKDALNKQYQEHYAPVELTSTPARHELDSGYAR
jgi:hypothetical protein